MSKQYQISEEELLQIIKMSYEAGCDGFMDLKENISNQLLKDALLMCKPVVDCYNNTSLTLQSTYTNNSFSVSGDHINLNGALNFLSNV